MKRFRRLLGFGCDVRAIAAIEFAFAAPLLIGLVAGGYEMSRAVSQARQLTSLANSIAMMLTTNTSGAVSYLNLHYAFDSAMINFPAVLGDSYSKSKSWNNDISISMAGVSFTPTVTGCTTSCTYKANIVWTGGSAARACGSNPSAAPDATSPSPSTLPTDLFDTVSTPAGTAAPLFVIAVDLVYTWSPTIFPKFFGSLTLKRSAYLSPRYVTQIKYSVVAGDDGFGKECPGF
jgi:Flp pilus assembly protein TadG